MMDTIETTYRIKCDQCGLESIHIVTKYATIRDPVTHWKLTGWRFADDGRTFCSECKDEVWA